VPRRHPTRFSDLADLARLPFFEMKEGRLVVADDTVPEAIDMHTHLALAFLRRQQLDLRASTALTETYLPPGRAIDLDVYMNRCFGPEDMAAMTRDLGVGSLSTGGMRASHTVPNLVRDMGALRIRQSVLLSIDWPYGMSDNAGEWLRAAHDTSELVVFGSVHPGDRHVERKLDAQLALGIKGIKVHPAVQLVKPDAPRSMALYRACGDRNLPIFFHCGPVDIETRLGRYLSQVRHYERAIAESPRTRFVLGHAGALQMEEALAFAKKYDNVWLELASQSLTNVERLVAEAPRDRVVFGTDWPFYPQSVGLAKVLIATEDDLGARRAVLGENAARLLALGPTSAARAQAARAVTAPS
jgi:predicted TIM-barrel fold metal-dependent hydrolase